MPSAANEILEGLRCVAQERASRRGDATLDAAVVAVKQYQHARFGHTYADLMAQTRYRRAAEFFLSDLYGPADFTDRDTQFARIVPALVRLFPAHIVDTVAELSSLHALSEKLDSSMARARVAAGAIGVAIGRASGGAMRGDEYGHLWRAVGDAPARERQIFLMVSVGRALDGYTRSLLLRQSLRVMRGPAAAAGLAALQGFLERGFDTFRDMRGADEFLATIASRERALAAALFNGDSGPDLPS